MKKPYLTELQRQLIRCPIETLSGDFALLQFRVAQLLKEVIKEINKIKSGTMIRKGNRNKPMTGCSVKIPDNPNPVHILACDPSMTGFGWVVLNQWGVVIMSNTIKTEPTSGKLRIRKGDDDIRRITEMVKELLTTIHMNDVKYIVSELPHGSQSAVSAKMLAYSIAAICSIAVSMSIPIEWYSEGDCKKAAAGRTSVEKKDMIELMRDRFPSMVFTGVGWKDGGTADALAVFCAGAKHSDMLQYLMNN